MQQSLQTWEEVNLCERTGDKVIQTMVQRVQDMLWVLPSVAEKTEDRALVPISPAGAESLEWGLLYGGPEQHEIRWSDSRRRGKDRRGLQTNFPSREGALQQCCKLDTASYGAGRVKIDEQNVKRMHTIPPSTDCQLENFALTRGEVHL
jgi:hypothetical protein